MATAAKEGLQLSFGGPDGVKFRAAVATELGKMPTQYLPAMWRNVVRWYGEIVLEQQYQTEGAFLGEAWAPVTSEYLQRKVMLGLFETIGKATGDMWKASTSLLSDENARWAVTKGGFGVEMEVTLPYADYFHSGTDKMPARPIDGDEGNPPVEVQVQLAKIMAMTYLLVMRQATRATDLNGNVLRLDGETSPTAWLSEIPQGQIDTFIDNLVHEVG